MGEFFNGLTWWSIAEQIVGYGFIILFIWGASVKFGKKDEFNEDYASIDKMKSLRGLAAIGVMLHHISQEYPLQEEGIMSAFVNAGAYFVAIFFFCSGYGLLKSLDTKKNYLKGFVGKRIVKAIVLPFYINVLIYGLMIWLVKIPTDNVQWVTNLLGLTMMNKYAWFPIVLALLYLLFFICFSIFKNPKHRPIVFTIIFIVIVLLGIGTCINGHFAWWTGPSNWWMSEDEAFWETGFKWWMNEKVFWFHGEWWVNSAPAFLTGLIFANYEKQIVGFFKKKYAIKFHVLLIITMLCYQLSEFGQSHFGYWTEFNGNGPEIGNKIATFFCQVPLFLVLTLTIVIFMMKFNVSNPVLNFFGKYSLHTYLMNLAAITFFRFMEYGVLFDHGHGNFFIYGVCVLVASTILGIIEQKITEWVQHLIYDKKPAPPPPSNWSLLGDDDEKPVRACVKIDDSEKTAEDKPEETAEEKAEDKSEQKTDDEPAEKAEEKTEDKTEEKAEPKIENKTEGEAPEAKAEEPAKEQEPKPQNNNGKKKKNKRKS